MNDLDRLVWADGLAFTAQGIHVGIRVDDPAMLEVIARHLPPDAVPTAGGDVDHLYSLWTVPGVTRRGTRPFKLLYSGTQSVAKSLQLEDLVVAFASHMNDLLATIGTRYIFVADTAVVVFNGAAALLVGGSASTRARLVDACTDRGAVSYSSAYAVLDVLGDAHPYREGPIAVRAVAFAHDEHVAPSPPAFMSPGRALVAMIEKTPSARIRPAAVIQALRAACSQASLRAGPWSDAKQVAADLLGGLGHKSAVALNRQGD